MEPKIMKRQSQLLKIIVVVSGRTNTELYHRNGYLVLPNVFTDEGLADLTNEILSQDPVREYFKASVGSQF